MSKAKTVEERHFYITWCIKESYSSRELERQINSFYYERLLSTSNTYKSEVKSEIDKLEKRVLWRSFIKSLIVNPNDYDVKINFL